MSYTTISTQIQVPQSLLTTVGTKDAVLATAPAALDNKLAAVHAEAKANHGGESAPRLRAPKLQAQTAAQLGVVGELERELTLDPVLAVEIGAELAQDAEHLRKKMIESVSPGTLPDRFGSPFPKDTAYAIFVVLIEALRLLHEIEKDASAKAQIAARDLTEMSGERLVSAANDELVGSIVALGAAVAMQGVAVKNAAKAAKIGTDSVNMNLKPSIATKRSVATTDSAAISAKGLGRTPKLDGPDTPEARNGGNARREGVVNEDGRRFESETQQAIHADKMIQVAKLTQYAQSLAALSMPLSTTINATASVEAAKDRAVSQMLQQGAETEKQHSADRTDQARNDKQTMDRMMEMVAEIRRIHAAVADHISSQV